MHRNLAFLAVLACCLTGCASFLGTPPGAVVGRYGRYDYSPSVYQSGTLQQFWWCGRAQNPALSSQDTDAILYESIDTHTHQTVGPKVVLAETPGAWDAQYTCNPHVIRGVFTNPLGDGKVYSYAMYYVGIKLGTNNSIGAAFSNDGIVWKKYPTPVIPSISPSGYGAAQPVPWNADQKQAITLFYEDDDPSGPPNHHFQAGSTDGIHFTTQGVFTRNGLDPNNPNPGWGDMALDPTGKYWYATFNLASRAASTTGGVLEAGSLGWQLYRIPQDALLTGTTGWQLVKNFDTNLTGYEVIAGAGILGDSFGNLYPGDQMTLFPAVSNPETPWNDSSEAAGQSASTSLWDIIAETWSPTDKTQVDLNRYKNGTTHLVTTGWTDPTGDFVLEESLGKLYVAPTNQAVAPLFGCKTGDHDYFVSLASDCEGQRILGINGYLYSKPVPDLKLTAVYRCATTTDHFVSQDVQCEGAVSQGLLGYIVP